MDGVSLTVNDVSATAFAVNLIPHTIAQTGFSSVSRPGRRVTIEIDLLARYVERMFTATRT